MKSYNVKYKDYEKLKLYISNNDIIKYNNILIQVFSGRVEKEFIEEVIENLKLLIPQCKIIGATSAGEILNDKIYEDECILSISVFEKTIIKTISIKQEISDFDKGVEIANKLIEPDTKVIISFGDASIDGQDFLEGINSINNKVVVAGGIVGKSRSKDETYVFTEDGVEKNTVVAAALESKELYVNNASGFTCIPIGKEHEITSVEENVIKSIDNIPAQIFYSKYLGTSNSEKISRIGAKFPLMIKRNNKYDSRPVIGFVNDEEIVISSKIDLGEKIRIGYCDLREVLKGSKDVYDKIKGCPGESLFIYSCYSRKKFLEEIGDKEIVPIFGDLSVSGFYTYGEFNHVNDENMFYSETMTILALSEDVNTRIKIDTERNYKCGYYSVKIQHYIIL